MRRPRVTPARRCWRGEGSHVSVHSTSDTAVLPKVPHCKRVLNPFFQKSRTPTVAKEFQIGLCGVVEADLELVCNSWSAEIFGERL